VHFVDAESVEKSFHVVEQVIDRPYVIGPRVGGLSVPAHITPDHAVLPG
jgi:hypothetical protein